MVSVNVHCPRCDSALAYRHRKVRSASAVVSTRAGGVLKLQQLVEQCRQMLEDKRCFVNRLVNTLK